MKTKTLRKKLFWHLLVLVLPVVFCACNRSENKKQPSLSEGSYEVYYLAQDGYRLLAYEASFPETASENLVEALFLAMKTSPQKMYYCVMDESIQLLSFSIVDRILILDLSKEYSELSANREILARAAIVRTFAALKDIDYVRICVEGKTLLDSNGTSLDVMKAEDYLDGLGGVTIKKTVTLYFADESRERLVEEERELECQNDVSMEQMILEALICGPEENGHYPVLPQDLLVPRIWIREGVCYVNFQGDFLKNKFLVKDILPIYAVVNSLSEQEKIVRVRILINGSEDEVFRGNISLQQAFERNLDLVTEDKE